MSWNRQSGAGGAERGTSDACLRSGWGTHSTRRPKRAVATPEAANGILAHEPQAARGGAEAPGSATAVANSCQQLPKLTMEPVNGFDCLGLRSEKRDTH